MTSQARSFAGSVSLLALGGVLTQGIGIAVTPILSRFFPPEAFGIQTAFLSVVTILASIATLKYELAIMLPEDDHDAAVLLVLNFILLGIFTLITGCAVAVSGEWVLGLPNLADLRSVIWLVPLGVFLTAAANSLNYWTLRTKRFGAVTGVRLSGKISQTAAALGSGMLGWITGGALVMSRLVENACYAISYSAFALRHDARALRDVSCARIRTLALRYRQFPLYTSWSGLLNTVSLTLPAFLVVLLFGAKAGGYYAQALALIQIPLFFVGDSIRDVLFPWAGSRKASGEDIAPFLDTLVRRLIMGIMFPVMMIFIAGPEIFTFVLGSGWTEAGVYSQILTPWMFLGFVATPLGVLLYVHERQRALLVYNILLIIARCATLIIAGMLRYSAGTALILLSLSSALLSGWIVTYALSLYHIPFRRLAIHTSRAFAFCIPALAVLAFGKAFLSLTPGLTVLLATLLAVPYVALTVHSDPELGRMGADIIRRFIPTGRTR